MKKATKFFAYICAMVMITLCFVSCGTASATSATIIDIKLTDEEYAFGVDKNQPELLDKVNAFIKKIMDDGTFDEICDKYFGDGEPTPIKSAKLDASKNQLVVATNAAFEPFEYMEGDNYYGVDMEIVALMAEEFGMELVISNMDFDAVCLSVDQGKCDIAAAGLTIKEDRKAHVNFSDKYYNAAQKLIVKSTDTTFKDCKTADDVAAKLKSLDSSTKIGVQNGTTGQLYVMGDEEWEFEGYDVECIGYKSGSLAVTAMLNNNIDYVIIDEAPARFIVDAINEMK